MAATKIWLVRGRLDSLIRYAENEEKRMPDLTSLVPAKDDLAEKLQYAANHSKTTQDRQLFVSGVNSLSEIACQQMELTKRQFGDTTGIVAFHAYQSFPPGEVTPEDCPRRFPTIAHPIRPCERICANGSRLKPSCICWSKLGRKWGNSLRRKPRSCKLWRLAHSLSQSAAPLLRSDGMRPPACREGPARRKSVRYEKSYTTHKNLAPGRPDEGKNSIDGGA